MQVLWSLWLLLNVVVSRASLFIPSTCQNSIPVDSYCGVCNGEFITEAPLSVRYEAHRFNVTLSNKQLKGGFLAYHCNSTYNVSMLANCPVIQKGELYFRNNSIYVDLHAGTECVFFGCYKKGFSNTCYQFQAVTITVPETATTTTMSSIIYPTMTSVPGPLSVVVTMVTTSLPSNTIIIRSGNVPITGTEKVSLVVACVLVFGVVMMVTVATVVLTAKLRMKYQDDSLPEWIKEDYKPVNISVAPSISCSLYTIIESLEKPQMEHPAQPVLNNNPPEVTAEVLKLSDDSIKNNCYLKTGHSNALEQSTQDIDSGSNCV
eukprot:Em0023g334a